jgi:hypothetical protein
MDSITRLVAETYRWQRRLGAEVTPTPFCSIVASPEHPEVWNHEIRLHLRGEHGSVVAEGP